MSKLIVGNWKMNGSLEMAKNFIEKLDKMNNKQVILCLPHPYLHIANYRSFYLGAQDCSQHQQGAYTGEVSAAMLHDIGCRYVIVGHSERRIYHNESNKTVQTKASIALLHQLTPIICIGEEERGNYTELLQQYEEITCDGVIIAYEPVWAIGTGLTPTTKEIEEITKQLKSRRNLQILYGGSITQQNCTEIAAIPTISGLLVGGASLDFHSFSHIIDHSW